MFPSTSTVYTLLTLALLTTAAPASKGLVKGLTGTVSSVVGNVPAQVGASCSADYQKCTFTVTGEIENILTDGGNFKGKTSISAWMQDGHGYGSIDSAGRAPLPLKITCDAKADVCTGTAKGNVTQVFSNGKQISLWGWLTPSGHCSEGVCVGSIRGVGDPAYKE